MKSTLIRWRLSHPRRLFIIRRIIAGNAKCCAPHRHDFAEVFWCCQGIGVQTVNGRRQSLQAGTLCLIRPLRDSHAIQGHSDDFTIINVAFPRAILDGLRRRYFNTAAFWGGAGPAPDLYHLTVGEHHWLNAMAGELLEAARRPAVAPSPSAVCLTPNEVNEWLDDLGNRLAIDRFLLNLLSSIGPSFADPYRACPAWLRQACHQVSHPDHLKTGVRALFALAGCSQEHTARTLKKHTGKTPTEIVNAARMAYAAGQLQTTTRKILDIALACGFSSLSHFYTVFQRAFGQSPQQYRLARFKTPVHPPVPH